LIDWQCWGSAAAATAATAAVPLLLFGVHSSVDKVTPATVLPVTIADGQQHVFPEGDVCPVVAFAVVIVKFTICSMLHYAMPSKLHWRQVMLFHCSRSSSQYSGQF
jgi:hypothetical protein